MRGRQRSNFWHGAVKRLIIRVILTGVLASPSAMAWPDGLFVVNRGDHSANLIHLPDGERSQSLDAGVGPAEISISSGGTRAAVSLYGLDDASGNRIAVFDLVNKTPPRFINLGAYRHPYGIAWRADNRHLLVVSRTRRALVEIDVDSGEVLRAIPTHQEDSRFLALDERRGQAYVVNRASGSISVIDLIGGRFARMVKVGEGSEGIALSPDGHQVWVVNGASNSVTVLDGDTLRPIVELPTGNSPSRIAFTPDGTVVGITNRWSSTVPVRYPQAGTHRHGAPARCLFPESRRMAGRGSGLVRQPDRYRRRTAVTLFLCHRELQRRRLYDRHRRTAGGKNLPAGRRPNNLAWIPAAADNAISTAK